VITYFKFEERKRQLKSQRKSRCLKCKRIRFNIRRKEEEKEVPAEQPKINRSNPTNPCFNVQESKHENRNEYADNGLAANSSTINIALIEVKLNTL